MNTQQKIEDVIAKGRDKDPELLKLILRAKISENQVTAERERRMTQELSILNKKIDFYTFFKNYSRIVLKMEEASQSEGKGYFQKGNPNFESYRCKHAGYLENFSDKRLANSYHHPDSPGVAQCCSHKCSLFCTSSRTNDANKIENLTLNENDRRMLLRGHDSELNVIKTEEAPEQIPGQRKFLSKEEDINVPRSAELLNSFKIGEIPNTRKNMLRKRAPFGKQKFKRNLLRSEGLSVKISHLPNYQSASGSVTPQTCYSAPPVGRDDKKRKISHEDVLHALKKKVLANASARAEFFAKKLNIYSEMQQRVIDNSNPTSSEPTSAEKSETTSTTLQNGRYSDGSIDDSVFDDRSSFDHRSSTPSSAHCSRTHSFLPQTLDQQNSPSSMGRLPSVSALLSGINTKEHRISSLRSTNPNESLG